MYEVAMHGGPRDGFGCWLSSLPPALLLPDSEETQLPDRVTPCAPVVEMHRYDLETELHCPDGSVLGRYRYTHTHLPDGGTITWVLPISPAG